ncbi:protein of unknown function (plasmid) [Cupriavidus taiwanensis]|nr:hypothetical protein CBM2598_U30132 [Cupriavidus taiwanensis]SPD38118.1 protein of unknown function [Cupriavidus taiwanensis]
MECLNRSWTAGRLPVQSLRCCRDPLGPASMYASDRTRQAVGGWAGMLLAPALFPGQKTSELASFLASADAT